MLNESAICRSKAVGRQGLNDLTLSLKAYGTASLRVSWIHDALLTRKAPKRGRSEIRTVNRHRWSRRVASGARVKPLQGTRQISPVT